MTKTPGEVEPHKPISKTEREARKAFRQVYAPPAMNEHKIDQKAFNNERLEREAATPPPAKTKPKPKSK